MQKLQGPPEKILAVMGQILSRGYFRNTSLDLARIAREEGLEAPEPALVRTPLSAIGALAWVEGLLVDLLVRAYFRNSRLDIFAAARREGLRREVVARLKGIKEGRVVLRSLGPEIVGSLK